jgi:hypothetical protein
MNPKRIALLFLIVSVVLSACVGIIAIIVGTFGRTEVQILLTTLTISAASICALACGALWEAGRAKLFPLIGIALAIVDAVLFIIGIWLETWSEAYWKFSAAVGLVAVATAHACLLSLARLAWRFAWSRVAAFIAAYLLAVLFIYIIYFTPKGDGVIRIIGVTSIVLAAMTILTPVFHRLSRGDFDQDVGPGPSVPTRFATMTCPQCGAPQANSREETKCNHCGCRFQILIIEPGSTELAVN